VKYKVSPRELYQKHLDEYMNLIQIQKAGYNSIFP